MKTITAHKIRIKTLEAELEQLKKENKQVFSIVEDLVLVISVPNEALTPGQLLMARDNAVRWLENQWDFFWDRP